MIDFSLQGSRHIGGCNQLLPSDLLLKSVQQIVTANAVHGILVPCRWLFPLSAKGNPLLAEPAEPYEACRSWKLFLALFTLSSLKQRTCHCRWFLWNSLSCLFVIRPVWPLQSHSFLPLRLHGFFALFVVLQGFMEVHHVPRQRRAWEAAHGVHRA